MKIIPFVSEPTDVIPGLVQEYVPPRERPYAQDWIVTHFSLDIGNGRYGVHGRFLDGRTFFWLLEAWRPVSWRYDLTNATFAIGRHVDQRKESVA